ncbi:hypothetical protein [Mycoplasma sp. Z386]
MKKYIKNLGFGAIATVLVGSGVAAAILMPINKENKKTINEEEQIKSSILEQLKQETQYQSKDVFVSKTLDKLIDNFSDLNVMLDQKIEAVEFFSNKDIQELEKQILPSNELNSNLFGPTLVRKDELENKEVFLGKDNQVFTDELEAKLSYFNVNSFYKYETTFDKSSGNAKIFQTKAELINYFESLYQEIATKNISDKQKLSELKSKIKFAKTNKHIKAPNDLISFSDISIKSNLDNFVKNNYKKYIYFKNKIYEYDNFIKNQVFDSYLSELPILKLNSTNGQNKFIVDLDKSVKENFYGKLFLDSPSGSINDIVDVNNWNKKEREEKLFTNPMEETKKSLVNNFVSRIIKQKSDANFDKFLLNSHLNENDKEKLQKDYNQNFSILNNYLLREDLENLKEEFSKIKYANLKDVTLWDKIQDANKILLKGKHGTIFNQIYSFYISSISAMFESKINFKTVYVFKKYIKSFLNTINTTLKEIFTDEFYVTENNEHIDLLKLYGLKDDLNISVSTSPDYFLGSLTQSTKFMNAINLINFATASLTNTNSSEEFDRILLLKDTNSEEELRKYKEFFELYSLTSKTKNAYNYNENTLEYVKNVPVFNSLNKSQQEFIDATISVSKSIKFVLKSSIEQLLTLPDVDIFNIKYEESGSSYIPPKEIKTLKGQYKDYFELISFVKFASNDFAIHTSLIDSPKFYDTVLTLRQEKDKILKKVDQKTHWKWTKKFKSTGKYTKPTKKHISEQNQKFLNKSAALLGLATDFIFFASTEKTLESTLYFIKNAAGAIKNLSKVLGPWAFGAEILFDFIIQAIGTEEFHEYVFKPNSEEDYIWQGGSSTKRFWGLWNKVNSDISKIKDKILTPVKILNATVKDEFYFNNKKYDQYMFEYLKKEVIQEIEKGNLQLEYIDDLKILYSFEKEIPTSTFDKKTMPFFESVQELQNYLANEDNRARYLTDITYLKFDSDNFQYKVDNYKELMKKFINYLNINLKPIYLLQVPELKDSYPLEQEKFLENPSLEKYDTSYLSREEIEKLLLNNDLSNSERFVVLDTNIRSNSKYVYLDVKKEIEQLLTKYADKFKVRSKFVLRRDIDGQYKYSELKSYQKVILYKTFDKENNVKYFLNYDQAKEFLKTDKSLDIRKEVYRYNPRTVYSYLGKEFDSKEELINYFIEEYRKNKIKGENNEKNNI